MSVSKQFVVMVAAGVVTAVVVDYLRQSGAVVRS